MNGTDVYADPELKERLYRQLARVGKCLSSDKRLEIMDLLSNGPKTVEGLAAQTGMSVANVSRHLKILLDACLVKFQKKGTYVIYSVSGSIVNRFIRGMWDLCEDQLADIRQIKSEMLQQYKEVRSISRQELREEMKRGKWVVLDVRPREEYEEAHIPGAISVPLEQLDEYLGKLAPDTKIAAYCRGPFCSATFRAVERMQEQGFAAYRIEEGVHEWELTETMENVNSRESGE